MRWKLIPGIVIIFATGLLAGVALAKKGLPAHLYQGVAPEQAAENLLSRALQEADKGSWENLAVARTYYLSGQKERGQALIDQVTARKMEKSDWLRGGRIYLEAGEWEAAREAFGKALVLGPKDEDILAEVGTYHNLRGERGEAEQLFARAFTENGEDFWVMVEIAGSYLGVPPGH